MGSWQQTTCIYSVCMFVFSCQVLYNSAMPRAIYIYSPPGSSLHGIFQARILEWVAISFSRESSQPRDWICVSFIGRWILYHWATWEARQLSLVVGSYFLKLLSLRIGCSLSAILSSCCHFCIVIFFPISCKNLNFLETCKIWLYFPLFLIDYLLPDSQPFHHMYWTVEYVVYRFLFDPRFWFLTVFKPQVLTSVFTLFSSYCFREQS